MDELQTTEQFNIALKNYKYVLVDYYAKWCGPCKKMSPLLEQLCINYPKIHFMKCDVDEVDTNEFNTERVVSLPTIRIYSGNIAHLYSYVGIKSLNELEDILASL